MPDTEIEEKTEHKPVDVFRQTDPDTGDWTDEEISVLLKTWEEVLTNSRWGKRTDLAHKIMIRLKDIKGFRAVEKPEIKSQMALLRKKYTLYKGLVGIGINAVRAPLTDQLEVVLDKIPDSRKRLYSDGRSEDFSRRPSVLYGEDPPARQRNPSESNSVRNDDISGQKPRVRLQRRMNLQRLIRIMVGQQNAILGNLDKLVASLEASNAKMLDLMENLVLRDKDPFKVVDQEDPFKNVVPASI